MTKKENTLVVKKLGMEELKDLLLLASVGVFVGLSLVVFLWLFFMISAALSGLQLLWNLLYYLPAVIGGLLGGTWYFVDELKRRTLLSGGSVVDENSSELPTTDAVGDSSHRREQMLVFLGVRKIWDLYFYLFIITAITYFLELLSEGLPIYLLYFIVACAWIALITYHVLHSVL